MEEGTAPDDSSGIAEAAMQELKIAAGACSRPSKIKNSLCQECSQTQFLYQCPRCSWRTCSLSCCKAHKERTECNGKRDRTKYLPLAHMSDATIQSDYHFLEDVLGAVERAKRSVGGGVSSNGQNKRQKLNQGGDKKNCAEEKDIAAHSMLQQIENFQSQQNNDSINDLGKSELPEDAEKEGEGNQASGNEKSKPIVGTLPQNCWKQLGPKWRHFWQQANLRGINVLMMPQGMQRRKANSSHIKKDIIYWKVDVKIHDSDRKPTIHSLKLSEQALLLQELQKLKLSTTNNNDGDTEMTVGKSGKLHWLIQKLPSPSNHPCYLELADSESTLQSTLKGMTIIEYPTIEAVPESLLSKFPRAIVEVAETSK